jgi:hypothetical protein
MSEGEATATDKNMEFSTDEFKLFLDQLKLVLTDTAGEALQFVFEKTFPPLAERMEMIAQAQIVLARSLRTNRRDANALEFAKMFIMRAMDQEAGAVEPPQIAALAYAMATEMEVHAQVNDMQSEAKQKNLEQHVEAAAPKTDVATLVNSYFGRDKESKKGKKH